MKAIKGMQAWGIIVILLLLTNLGWMSWNVYQNTGLRANAKQFKMELLHTNDVSPWPFLSGENASAIGIVDIKTGQPIWVKWNLNRGVNMDIEGYHFRGEHVFDIFWTNNRPPVYSVYFHGPGKSVTWWQNRNGCDTFTERFFYDTNGDFSRHEVWYDEAWHVVDRRNEINGIVLNGQWRQLRFDTNGMWTIEAP